MTNTNELVDLLASKAIAAPAKDANSELLAIQGDFLNALYAGYQKLVEEQAETQRQLQVLQRNFMDSQPDPSYVEPDINDVLDHVEGLALNIREVLAMSKERDDKLTEKIDAEVQGLYHVISGEQFEIRSIKAQLTSTKNAVGYCLRKVQEAIATDPQNAYLKQVLDAVDDLATKVNDIDYKLN